MKKILLIILLFLFSTGLIAETIYQSYIIKDPYPSKLAWAFSLIETPYFITLRIDKEKTYHYTMNFIEADANTSLAWAVIKSITGTASSGAYDVGTNTLSSYYQEALGVD